MSHSVEVILDFMPLPPLKVWEMLLEARRDVLLEEFARSSSSPKRHATNVTNGIRRSKKPHWGVHLGHGEIHYGHVRNQDCSLLWIRHIVHDHDDACVWVAPFAELREFRHAWIYDDEYDLWQNADDTIEYETRGLSYDHLPLVSNGLPYPLNRMVIDTSRNPGRRVFRDGYVEVVASVMWLGEQFWQLTGADKEKALQQDWLKCEELPCGVLRVLAADEPFTTAEGECGRVQDRLRALLFPKP